MANNKRSGHCMLKKLLYALLLLSSPLLSDEPTSNKAVIEDISKTYGLGLPRDINKLAPEITSYPDWQTKQYNSVDISRLQQVVTDLSAFALEDKVINKYWGRLPGTEADKKTMAYLSENLKGLGYKLSLNKTAIPIEWKPVDWSMNYQVNGKIYNFITAFPSGSGLRASATTQAEAIWLGLGSKADFKGRDVKDKVAVIYSMFVPGGRSHSASNRSKLFFANKRAAEQGARLIVNIMGVPGNGQFMPAPHYYTRGKVITALDIPVVTISQDEGFALRDDMAKNNVVISFNSEWIKQENLVTNYLIAELEGQSSEEIIIAAHTDGYFEGALDNASGVAVALEMAHYYANQEEKPERTIKLFFFSDHHHGEFTRREFEQAYEWNKVALVITVEHPSQTQLYWYNDGLMTSNAIGAFRWNVTGSNALKNTILDSFRENGISTYTLMDKNPKFTKQAPGFHIIDHVIYHTTLDIPELVPTEGLKRATKSFLEIVDRSNSMSLSELRGDR